jgi:LytS/YehU family sensor histidine kinase
VAVLFHFLFSLVRPSPPVPDQSRLRHGMPDTVLYQADHQFPGQRGTMPSGKPFRPFGPDYRRMTEFLFIFLITILLGKVFELINVKQQMYFENEKLRSENLQNRYDVLINQINPHFFFNSLNSLSSLVREGRNENALRYIDELSNTYRYAMQSSGKELVTVAEELESLKAYSYLLEIRFEGKLFIENNIDDSALNMLLPVLSLQPLIENVVKHNVISTEAPLTITITGNREGITVMNPIRMRSNEGERSGTGLNNLATRYRLLTGKDLLIERGGDIFSVMIPVINPDDA